MADGSVQSVERTFLLLETLAARPRGMGLMDLATRTGLNKSTVHRLLSCLSGLGYVVKDSFTGQYRLTYKLLELSNGMLDDVDVLSAAKPHLDALAERTGETVHLMVPDAGQGVYIYKSQPKTSGGAMQMRSRVGLRVPLATTAAGKAMQALGGAESAELDEVRARGWAVDNEENERGIRCIGTAIPDHKGRPLAAMSISANAAEMTPRRLRELAPLMLDCRDSICKDMGQ